jgi:hypothetical protein
LIDQIIKLEIAVPIGYADHARRIREEGIFGAEITDIISNNGVIDDSRKQFHDNTVLESR